MKDTHRVLMKTGIVVSLAVLVLCFISPIYHDIHKSNLERRHLLYETDHAALLTACREVMANRHDYMLFEGDRDADSFDLDPEHPDLPPIIRDLGPGYMTAEKDRLFIELHGGMDHYGVIALSEELAYDPDQIRWGDFELLPGLLYHDELLRTRDDGWMMKLKTMKPRDAPEPTWWNAPPIHSSPARTPTPVFPESSRVWKLN